MSPLQLILAVLIAAGIPAVTTEDFNLNLLLHSREPMSRIFVTADFLPGWLHTKSFNAAEVERIDVVLGRGNDDPVCCTDHQRITFFPSGTGGGSGRLASVCHFLELVSTYPGGPDRLPSF